MACHLCRCTFTSNQGYPGHLTIDMLSDDVLLCIFDSCSRIWEPYISFPWYWYNLVHVCRRWRRIIFGYPRYLGLYLKCKSKTDVLAMLDIWPALPLIFHANPDDNDANKNNIISALEHRDRMARICVRGSQFTLKKCVALMQEPFPVLTSLLFDLEGYHNTVFVITDAFLGGYAPLLQHMSLGNIRFPGLPKLLSSTGDLVSLNLEDFPMTGEGHIPPDAMTTCLSLLTKLQSLTITFLQQMSSGYPADQCPPPSTQTVLPVLVYLKLVGPHGYLEDLVGRVDAPVLNSAWLEFDDDVIFDTPRALQLIHRARMFKLPLKHRVRFDEGYPSNRAGVDADFCPLISPETCYFLSFPCSGLPAQLATMERILSQCPLVSRVESLQLDDEYSKENERREVITPSQWLGFLRQFTAVQTLSLRVKNVVPRIADMLGGLEGEKATETLPALRTIELGGPKPVARSETLRLLGPFLVTRKESEHPVVVDFVL